MARDDELETLVYCLGTVGGKENPVITKIPETKDPENYTKKGYDRYIKEAKNVHQFMQHVLNFFLDSVSEHAGNHEYALIAKLNSEDIQNSVPEMRKQWRRMYKEHEKEIRKSLEDQKQAHLKSLGESGSSSAKLPKLDSEADPGAALEAKMPVDNLVFPENIFMQKKEAFADAIRNGYKSTKDKMGAALVKAWELITGIRPANDLQEFTLQRMEKLAKYKYYLKTLNHLIVDLKLDLDNLRLDIDEIQENEYRLTDFVYYNGFGNSSKYHHKLLVTMELSCSISEISALAKKLIRKWKKISKDLKRNLRKESETFDKLVEEWRDYISPQSLLKEPLEPQLSNTSDDTLKGVEELEEDK